jgi:hypothetical protein
MTADRYTATASISAAALFIVLASTVYAVAQASASSVDQSLPRPCSSVQSRAEPTVS